MALANEQEIPERPLPPSEPWTFRRLFPLKAAISAIAKSFTTPFDILLVFQFLIIGVSELIGREISLMFYILTAMTLVFDVIERRIVPVIIEKKKIKK